MKTGVPKHMKDKRKNVQTRPGSQAGNNLKHQVWSIHQNKEFPCHEQLCRQWIEGVHDRKASVSVNNKYEAERPKVFSGRQ